MTDPIVVRYENSTSVSVPVCSWTGVVCNSQGQPVVDAMCIKRAEYLVHRNGYSIGRRGEYYCSEHFHLVWNVKGE